MNSETNKKPALGKTLSVAQSIVFASLVIGGSVVFAVVSFSGIDGFLPYIASAGIAIVSWQKFLKRPAG